MRHVSRNHRVALAWLFDRNNLEPKIKIQNVITKNQLADTLTKGSFSRDGWNHLLCFFQYNEFLDGILVAILATFFPTILVRLECKTPCPKEARRRLRMEALQRRKQKSEEISSKCFGSRVNQVYADERKEVVRATRQLVLPASNPEIGCSRASRQKNSPQASKKLVLGRSKPNSKR